MILNDYRALRQGLPQELPFQYYPDRESPWILHHAMAEVESVTELKSSRLARFLDRPAVKPAVAASGGRLKRADVFAAAYADQAANDPDLSLAGTAAVVAAFAAEWHDFLLSFCGWSDIQTSRSGVNLVIQLGFPSNHSALMGKYLSRETRKTFEFRNHPVRRSGRPTLAWARVDIGDDVALIEEVQTDWLRFARQCADDMEQQKPQSRHARAIRNYETDLRKRYDKLWPRAMLLATLGIIRDVLQIRTVFMHQPDPGSEFKGITGDSPPRSLYSKLPKHFGFEPTDDVPPFLAKPCRRTIATLRKQNQPLFWRLSL